MELRDGATDSLGAAAAKISPPAVVAAASVAEMGLQDWVYILTITYTALLITHHVWKNWIKPWRDRRAFRRNFEIPGE